MDLIPRTPLVLAALLASSTAVAGSVQVQVMDESGNPLARAALYLESPEASAAARPLKGVEIVQAHKQFTPRVTVVPVGSAVEFPNRDTVRHHVYSFSPAKNFELKLYAGKPANPVLFDKPGVVSLGCNIHDQMSAWVVVVDTPYLAVSGADGRAVIDAVPPGNYRLRIWHEGLPAGAPALTQPLTVTAGAVASQVQVRGVRS